MVHFMKPRIKYLLEEIIPKCDHNTILFCHHTEYLRYVEQQLKERFPERHIASISGSVGSKKRDEIKQMLKEHNDLLLRTQLHHILLLTMMLPYHYFLLRRLIELMNLRSEYLNLRRPK